MASQGTSTVPIVSAHFPSLLFVGDFVTARILTGGRRKLYKAASGSCRKIQQQVLACTFDIFVVGHQFTAYAEICPILSHTGAIATMK